MIDASRVVLVMTKKECSECDIEHWEFFATKQDVDDWVCSCQADLIEESVD